MLAAHHGTPPHQSTQLLGMTWSKNGGGKGNHNGGGHGSWSYWRGTWSPSQKSNAPWRTEHQQQWNQNQHKKSFPHYDAVPRSERPALVEVASSSQSDGYVTDLQKAVNSARKSEQRVKKIQAERLERQEQWRSYEAELRRCYAQEKQRYKSALARLEKDEMDAAQEQAFAREQLRRVATGHQDVAMRPLESPEEQDFDRLIQSTGPDPLQEEDSDSVIRRALAHPVGVGGVGAPASGGTYLATLSTPTRTVPRTPSTPLGSTPSLAAADAPTGLRPATALTPGNGNLAVSDPYQIPLPMSSDSAKQRSATHGHRHCSPGGGPRPRESLGVRTSVKEASKVGSGQRTSPGGAASLADKLEMRRQQLAEDAKRKAEEARQSGMWMGPPVPLEPQRSANTGVTVAAGREAAPARPVLASNVPVNPDMHLLDDDLSEEEPGDLEVCESQADVVDKDLQIME